MTQSKLIAGLIGPVMVAMGVAVLLNRNFFPALMGQMARDVGLIFLSGVLLLLAGIAIVRVHNVWTGGWRIIVTVLGWLAIVSGLVRMFFPQFAAPIVESLGRNATALILAGLVVLALGAFLSYKAYGTDT
jgi:uncharacterized protein YjeT (DUF2065 family)